jgi:hypothetical protein
VAASVLEGGEAGSVSGVAVGRLGEGSAGAFVTHTLCARARVCVCVCVYVRAGRL